ncbi:hypothetical protein FRC04_009680 [Tulasnella sp. 424]|nr:hypothetical protein FRC04_009680 [Tulasnella sp. 424]KAG8973206.1 hypothetical protein FRC05_009068 [Tulasnella sp. 425]
MDGEDLLASSAFLPLPFRVLSLVGLGIVCWTTNLHFLHLLGIDTSAVLETRTDKIPLSTPPSPPTPGGPRARTRHLVQSSASQSLYTPLYRLLFYYNAWLISCYVLYNLSVKGDMQKMDQSRIVITLAAVGVVVGLFCPFNILAKRERYIFLHAVRRCILGTYHQPVYFSDVILADIFTSFAKVLGDLWVSAYMLLPGGSLMMSNLDIHGWSEWAVPALISLPYAVRFKQCLAEYYYSRSTNTRSLWNALKYASSFPVIFLSAMQKQVIADITASKGADVALKTTWHGEHHIFRFWPSMVYYAAIALNLILRFTWSMRLSPHMHTFAELETGVFVVEACELLRRWLWVFFRVEWETIKKGLAPDTVYGGEMEMSERGTLSS